MRFTNRRIIVFSSIALIFGVNALSNRVWAQTTTTASITMTGPFESVDSGDIGFISLDLTSTAANDWWALEGQSYDLVATASDSDPNGGITELQMSYNGDVLCQQSDPSGPPSLSCQSTISVGVNTTNGQVTVTYKDKMGNQFSVTGSFKKRPAPGIIEAQAVLRDNAQTPPTTTPLTGVHVDLMRVLKNGSEKFIQDGDTFADGKIKFQNLSVGNNYKVLATLGGMEMFACPGLLEAAGVNVLSNATTQVVFTFDKRYGVKGKVTVFDANGNNVTQNEAANVAINVYSVQGQTENLVRTVGIAPNGDYDTGPLRGGNYRIEATHPRAANRPSSNVTIAQCQITPVTGVNFTLTLQPPQGG